jgi:phosphoribosylamine-glycine ligase
MILEHRGERRRSAATLQDADAFSGDSRQARSVFGLCRSFGALFAVLAMAKDLKAAQTGAYGALKKIHFDGEQFRRDIAAKALINLKLNLQPAIYPESSLR